jgi:hypothetical protein
MNNTQQSRLICGLFNDAMNSSDYTAPNDRIINKYWIGKNMEESGGGLI